MRANDDHEAKFPLELPLRVIRLLTDPGEIVLDCFIGSGTTALAALQLNRQFIGIELQAKYVELARRTVSNGVQIKLLAESQNEELYAARSSSTSTQS